MKGNITAYVDRKSFKNTYALYTCSLYILNGNKENFVHFSYKEWFMRYFKENQMDFTYIK